MRWRRRGIALFHFRIVSDSFGDATAFVHDLTHTRTFRIEV